MIQIRLQEISDAQRFYEILNNPNFLYWGAKPESVEAERDWIKSTYQDITNNHSYNFTILYDNEVVGGIGLKINSHRTYIGEVGYFLDEKYWGKGIVLAAFKLLEEKCWRDYKLKRIEIVMQPGNLASERVAIKAGYLKEGLMKKVIHDKINGEWKDVWLYAKTL